MTASTTDRDTRSRENKQGNFPLAAVKVYAGTIAAINAAGYVTKGITATTLKAVGIFSKGVDNSAGAAGDKRADIDKGCFRLDNSAAADLITLAEVGSNCYIVDDQTVAKTDGTGTRSVAGKIVDVDADGVWVDFN